MLNWLINLFQPGQSSNRQRISASVPVNKLPLNSKVNSTTVLKKKGDDCLDVADWRGAEGYYRQVIAIDGSNAAAFNNLGLALMQQRRFDEAAQSVEKAIAQNPGSFDSHYILAMIAHQLGKPREAVSHLRNATKFKPNFSEAFNYTGNLLVELGDRDGAAEAYLSAISTNPNLPESLCNLAGILQEQGRRSEAIAYYRRALELSPNFNSARLNMIHQLQQVCDWQDLDANIALVCQHMREAPFDVDSRDSPFAFLALPGSTSFEQKLCAEKWTKSAYRSEILLKEQLNFHFNRPPNPKIKLGYLSADFHMHATAMLMAKIFELHDKERFHVTAYSYGPDDQSEMRLRLEDAFDEFVDIREESQVETAKRIYADGIDILVDLKGYTGDTRSGILALRAAPIQVNFLGYPGTMGADFVDYLIADRFIIPPESGQHYTEKLVYLPDCYQPNDRTRPKPQAPTRLSQQLPESGVVFCCFNQTYKITPQVFDVWCRLLIAVPDGILWLLSNTAETEANLRREASKRGVGSERLLFAPRVTMAEHLARLQCADLFLDTLPYNAHTTCSEALWMGLPVVTCVGDPFASRV
ncbi:MAG: tetratricopeptide repeat protein, partial [Pseudomonadota bacterium]